MLWMGRWVRGLAQFGREVVAREARMRSGLDNVGAHVRGAWGVGVGCTCHAFRVCQLSDFGVARSATVRHFRPLWAFEYPGGRFGVGGRGSPHTSDSFSNPKRTKHLTHLTMCSEHMCSVPWVPGPI